MLIGQRRTTGKNTCQPGTVGLGQQMDHIARIIFRAELRFKHDRLIERRQLHGERLQQRAAAASAAR